MSVLTFDEVRAYYDQALVVDGVSFTVEEGECFSLLGPNGVGKTTSLNAMFGIARLGGGQISIDDVPINLRRPHDAARKGAALVPQGRWIIPTLTVEENLLLGQASERKGPWGLAEVFDMFPDLQDRRAAMGNALSGGQQQMLAIGRGLMAHPRILLLDEPSEGLAPVIIDRLRDVLARLREEGTSMLLIEQRLDFVLSLADRFSVMAKGEVVASGTVADTSAEQLREWVAA
jgi:branched-chain amino acid transport system ATP-binding protein